MDVFTSNTDPAAWFHFDVVAGSSTPDAPGEGRFIQVDAYVTDWQRDASLAFLDAHGAGEFLLLVPFQAPHPPQFPDLADQDALSGFQHRPPSYNEDDVSDKPAWVRETLPLTGAESVELDEIARNQLRCLLSVDRAVGEVLDKVEEIGASERTVVVFTSDNGTLWGEHRQARKGRDLVLGQPLPLGVVGEAYSEPLQAVGGASPYTWSALEDLPPGLTLSPEGELAGTPTEVGTWPLALRVTDGSTSPHHGGPQQVIARVSWSAHIAPPEEGCGCGHRGASWAWLIALVGWRRRR